jgi:hypothetical protein
MKKTGERSNLFLIGEVSRQVDLSQKRIREYENEGFISPRRDPATNNRLYSDFDINQINRIKSLIHDHGFTIACLKHLLVSAPCWNIFSCEKKDSCPASQNPSINCYDVLRRNNSSAVNHCKTCPVYRCRNTPKIKVLEKTPA